MKKRVKMKLKTRKLKVTWNANWLLLLYVKWSFYEIKIALLVSIPYGYCEDRSRITMSNVCWKGWEKIQRIYILYLYPYGKNEIYILPYSLEHYLFFMTI